MIFYLALGLSVLLMRDDAYFFGILLAAVLTYAAVRARARIRTALLGSGAALIVLFWSWLHYRFDAYWASQINLGH